jgi:hypothetical protein
LPQIVAAPLKVMSPLLAIEVLRLAPPVPG